MTKIEWQPKIDPNIVKIEDELNKLGEWKMKPITIEHSPTYTIDWGMYEKVSGTDTLDLISDLISVSASKGLTLYNICRRNDNWAIVWHNKKKQGNGKWKDGLETSKYYPSLYQLVFHERLRIIHNE